MNEKYFDIAHSNLKETIMNRIINIEGGKLFETDDFLLFTIGIPSTDGHLNGCLPFNDNAYSGGKLSDWNSCKAVDGFYSCFSLSSPRLPLPSFILSPFIE